MSKANLNTLLHTLQKAAGIESLNPPTSHESGGTPDNVANVSTGAFFAEQEAETAKRPGPTPDDNPVKSDNPVPPATVPVNTKLPGDDPAEERNVTGTVQDKNETSHPANGSHGDKYASSDMLKQAADAIANIVKVSNERLAQFAKGTTQKSAAATTDANAGTDQVVTVDAEVEKYAASLEANGYATELANYFRGFESIDAIRAVHQKTAATIAQTRELAEKQANLLADEYDKQLAMRKAAQAKAARPAKAAPVQKTAAATIYARLANLLNKQAEDTTDDDDEGSTEPAADPAASAPSDPAADPAMAGAAPVDPAAMGVDPAAMGADPAMMDDPGMGMGGAEALDPELLAMLNEAAAQHGVSVEELIMALAQKQASAAISPKETDGQRMKAMQALAKEALTAARDVVQRGSR